MLTNMKTAFTSAFQPIFKTVSLRTVLLSERGPPAPIEVE
jgi:hypothetical protein